MPNADSRVVLVPALASKPALLPGRLIRVIEDPNLGDRWLLCRSFEHPGGPGRLLLAAAESGSEAKGGHASGTASSESLARAQVAIRPAVRAGDRVIVEEISAVAEARLGAVALESAGEGASFNARLEIGGRIVRAVALGAGRAAFKPEMEARQ
jgi:hypothetical protein